MKKQIEELNDEDLAELWPAIGGAPHLFEYGKDELRAQLIGGFVDESTLMMDYYTMAAIVDILRKRGFVTKTL